MGRVGRRQRGVGAKTIDPRIDFRGGCIIAGGDRSACAFKALCFPGVAVVGLGLGGGGLAGVEVQRVHGVQHSPVCGRQPGFAADGQAAGRSRVAAILDVGQWERPNMVVHDHLVSEVPC